MLAVTFSKLYCQNNIGNNVKFNFEKGLNYYKQNKLDSSLVYFKKIEKNNLTDLEGDTYYYLGHIYKINQNFEISLDYFKKAEKEFIKINDINSIAKTYISIAEFYRSKYDFDLAEDYLNKVEAYLNKNLISKDIEAYYWNRKAAIYTEKYHDPINSIKCSEKVLILAKEINDSSLIASSYNEIAFIYENLDDKRAEIYYKKSIEISDKLGDDLSHCHVILNLVRYYHRIKKISTAKGLIDKADELLKKNNFTNKKKEVCDKYYLYYSDIKDFKTALKYHEELLELEKADLINKWNEELVEAERKYEFDSAKENLELNELLIDKKNNEIVSTKKNLFLLLTILLISAFGITILFIYSKQIQSKNKKLAELHQENQFLISETNHRVNNNLQLISLLISDAVKKKQSEEHKNDFLKLLSKVDTIALLHRHLYQTKNKTSINLKKYLEEIKTNFDEISEEKKITIDFEISFVEINSDSAMYIGLLVTELIINSVKYAFNEVQDKNICLTINSQDNILYFKYCDNGEKAIGRHIEPKLIHQLCLQLDVNHQITTTQGFCLIFEKKLI